MILSLFLEEKPTLEKGKIIQFEDELHSHSKVFYHLLMTCL